MNPASIRSLFAIFLTMCVLGPEVRAQRLTEFAPLEWHFEGTHATDAGATTLLLGVGRAVPVFTVLPQTTFDSRFRILDLSIGGRTSNGQNDFRYKATLLDVDVQRTPQSASFTLMDVDRSGFRDSHITWARLGYGPAFSRTTWRRQATLKTRLEAGLVSSKWGPTLFADIPGSNRTYSGMEARALGIASVTLSRTVDMAVVAWHAIHSFKGDFRYSAINPTLSWFAKPSVRMDLSLIWVRAAGNNAETTDIGGGLRLSYTPRAIRF